MNSAGIDTVHVVHVGDEALPPSDKQGGPLLPSLPGLPPTAAEVPGSISAGLRSPLLSREGSSPQARPRRGTVPAADRSMGGSEDVPEGYGSGRRGGTTAVDGDHERQK